MLLVARMPPRADTAAAALIASAIARHVFPAAVVETGTGRGLLWRQSFGSLTFDTDAPPATSDTLFDLASLTKPISTTTVALALCASGPLRLDDPVATYAPEWISRDRSSVTIEQLLEHASGLSGRLPGPPPADPREFEHEISTGPLEAPPGTRAIYSDLGFILLGICLERAGDAALADQAAKILRPILDAVAGHSHDVRLETNVPRTERRLVAPTRPLPEDVRRGRRLQGEVHDNYAAVLGGFAGHAGLFGTAGGVGAFAQAMLRALAGDEMLPPPLAPSLMQRAVARSRVSGSSRALGWDTMLTTSSCGTRMSTSAVGHVGFTGTSLWIDPARDRYVVLLTNRVCDGGSSDDMQEVRRAVHDTLADL